LFVKTIALPQDHGSWVFLLSPLLIGLFAGGRLVPESLFLILAALAGFLARQPLTAIVKVATGRRPRADLPAAFLWAAVYGLAGAGCGLGLVLRGHGTLLWLAVPAIPIFAWHLWLVSRRAERRQAGVEIVATGVLALSAPAAYWIGQGRYSPLGWALWLLPWLQSAASIVYAYLRLDQRRLEAPPGPARMWAMGRRALLYTSFNLALAGVSGLTGLVPPWIAIPFLLQWLETLWGVTHPAVGVKPTRIGVRQLLVSSTFTALFILAWQT
jgi:hypothetical protein